MTHTEYSQILHRLFSAPASPQITRSLNNAQCLNQALGFPTSSYATVHIAGSNGKGSVTSKIAKVLELSGYRVGVYTSPHLFSFRERIAVNGELISEEAVIAGMQHIFTIAESLQLEATFFELTTFLAFDYFRKQNVDFAIIETGLGGRLDSTNVIQPLLTVITSISCEHAYLLGDTVEAIAAEKAGILKPQVPVILGPKARMQSIYHRAQELNCPVIVSKKISEFYDEENTEIARLAISHLPCKISPESLELGLSFRPPCRFEKIGQAIFDVAHNPDAIFYLLRALHIFYPESKFQFVVGFSKDKDYPSCLDLIADAAAHIHLVRAESPRAATLEELAAALHQEDPQLFTAHPSIEEAVKIAYAQTVAQQEILVICGSFYIMENAKAALLQHYPFLSEMILEPEGVSP